MGQQYPSGIAFVLGKAVRPELGYTGILDSHIDPIAKHLTLPWTKVEKPIEGYLPVFFAREGFENAGVFISHGIADKGYRDRDLVWGFDYVGVSGPAWREKYLAQGMNPGRVVEVGYPKLDWMFSREGLTLPALRTLAPVRPTVLWAPTHAVSEKRSSYPWAQKHIEAACRKKGWDLIISLHPQSTKGATKPTMEAFGVADVVVADSGSTMYEAWALGLPVVFPDYIMGHTVLMDQAGTFEEQVYRENIGYHAASAGGLVDALGSAMHDGITVKETEFIEGIFPKRLRGVSGLVAAQVLESIAKGDRN